MVLSSRVVGVLQTLHIFHKGGGGVMADTMVLSSRVVGLLQTPQISHKEVVGLWLIPWFSLQG